MKRRWIGNCALGCALALGAGALSAAPLTPDQFAFGWPISTAGKSPAYRIELTPEVYAALTRRDLGDLAIFDADGLAIPYAFIEHGVLVQRESFTVPVTTKVVRSAPPTVAAPSKPAEDASIAVEVERDPNGHVRVVIGDQRVDLQHASDDSPPSDGGAVPGRRRSPEHDWTLIGVRGIAPRMIIDLTWNPEVSDARLGRLWLEFDSGDSGPLPRCWLVDGSQPIGAQAGHDYLALSPVYAGEAGLLRASVEIDRPLPKQPQVACYGPGVNPEFRVLRGELSGSRTFSLSRSLSVTPTPAAAIAGDPALPPGAFQYSIPGPLPIHRASLTAAGANTIAHVRLNSRGDARQPFQQQSDLVLQSLTDNPQTVTADLGLTRDQYWRLYSDPPLAQAPLFVLSYDTEFLLFLAQGRGPYELVAGNARQVAPAPRVDNLLGDLSRSLGSDWTPPAATLGPQHSRAGTPAQEPKLRGDTWTRILLWLLLGGGVVGVTVMVMRLMRESK